VARFFTIIKHYAVLIVFFDGKGEISKEGGGSASRFFSTGTDGVSGGLL